MSIKSIFVQRCSDNDYCVSLEELSKHVYRVCVYSYEHGTDIFVRVYSGKGSAVRCYNSMVMKFCKPGSSEGETL